MSCVVSVKKNVKLCCVRVSDAVTSYLSDAAAAGSSKGYSAMNPYLINHAHQLRPSTRWSPVNVDFDASDTEDTAAGAIHE